MIEVVEAFTELHVSQARELSRDYVSWLAEREKEIGIYDYEADYVYGYEGGVAELPGEFVAPHGCLLLALYGGVSAGCVALSKSEVGVCEMRLLFVLPQFRRKGIGNAMTTTLLEHAQRLGYRAMRLGTAAFMTDAYRLYSSHGFQQSSPYFEVPQNLKPIFLFMEKPL